MTDKQNLEQFRDVMKHAYAYQKEIGDIQDYEMARVDKLFQLGHDQKVVTRDGRVLSFWRTFRRRVAYQYAKHYGLRVNFRLNWRSVWEWILSNWQTIIRIILFLVPLIIE